MGFMRRPVILRHGETIDICQLYLDTCRPLWDDMHVFQMDRSIFLQPVLLPWVDPHERWNLYLRLLAERRR